MCILSGVYGLLWMPVPAPSFDHALTAAEELGKGACKWRRTSYPEPREQSLGKPERDLIPRLLVIPAPQNLGDKETKGNAHSPPEARHKA